MTVTAAPKTAAPGSEKCGGPKSIGQLAALSFLPERLRERESTLRWIDRIPLVMILLVQLVLALRLQNSVFRDEGLYIWTGRELIESVLFGKQYFDRPSSYFSGAPAGYPVLAGAIDYLGGLELVRLGSTACILGTTCAVYALTLRLFGRRAAIAAAFTFAVTAPVLLLSRLATFDAPAVLLLASAAVGGVRSAGRRKPWAALQIGLLLAAAVACKYAAALFVPVVLTLLVVTGWTSARWRSVAAAGLAAATCAGLVGLVLGLWGGGVLEGLAFSTTHRRVMLPAPATTLGLSALKWAGPTMVIGALGGIVVGLRRPLLALTLLGGGFVATAYQLHLGEMVSLAKHVGFGMIFLTPLAGCFLSALLHRWRTAIAMLATWAIFTVGYSQSNGLYQEWGSTAAVRDVLQYKFDAGPYARVLADPMESLRYDYRETTQYWQWQSYDFFEYQGEVGQPAFEHALRDGYFQLVVAHRDSPMASALVPRLETFGYQLSDRVADARFPDLSAEWLIYERWS
jgi:4-amino-4-deoxy-L-arabinose transferase-like glycosyltransferase